MTSDRDMLVELLDILDSNRKAEWHGRDAKREFTDLFTAIKDHLKENQKSFNDDSEEEDEPDGY